jgi:hypothetical protein
MTVRVTSSGGTALRESGILTGLRYLVSVLVAGLVLGFALSTQLDAFAGALALPIAIQRITGLGAPLSTAWIDRIDGRPSHRTTAAKGSSTP